VQNKNITSSLFCFYESDHASHTGEYTTSAIENRP
jgi:hypothetical protein